MKQGKIKPIKLWAFVAKDGYIHRFAMPCKDIQEFFMLTRNTEKSFRKYPDKLKKVGKLIEVLVTPVKKKKWPRST